MADVVNTKDSLLDMQVGKSGALLQMRGIGDGHAKEYEVVRSHLLCGPSAHEISRSLGTTVANPRRDEVRV